MVFTTDCQNGQNAPERERLERFERFERSERAERLVYRDALKRSSSATVSPRIAAFNVGSRSGSHSGECGAGTGTPVRFATASFAGLTAPMCSSNAGTPARPYSAKSSDVIFAGI